MDLWLWLSMWDNFPTIQSVKDAARQVHLPGYRTGILIPTYYDDSPQSAFGTTNYGDELKVSGPEGALAIRTEIESDGDLRCGGWSVPRGTGDIAEEGRLHGLCAAVFNTFVLNFEQGWPNFWATNGPDNVLTWLGGFWGGVEEGGATAQLNGNVGCTFVTNIGMMQSVGDPEAAAWVGGTNFDCLEAYVPGDPGLDPSNAIRIWKARLAKLGVVGRSVVPIFENGDLPTLIPQFADAAHGAHIWTLANALDHAWPDVAAPEPTPDVPVPDELASANAHIGELEQKNADMVNSLGWIAGDLLRPVLRSQTIPVQALVAGIRREATKYGIKTA